MLITTADADPADRDAVLSLLDRAGATVDRAAAADRRLHRPEPGRRAPLAGRQTLPTGVDAARGPAGRRRRRRAARLGADRAADGGGGRRQPEQSSGRSRRAHQRRLHHGHRHAGRRTVGGHPDRAARSPARSEADRAAAVADLATELKQAATGRRGGRPIRLRRGELGVGRGDPQRHRRQRGGQHRRQRGLGDRADRDRARPWSSRTAAESAVTASRDNAQAQVPTLAVG